MVDGEGIVIFIIIPIHIHNIHIMLHLKSIEEEAYSQEQPWPWVNQLGKSSLARLPRVAPPYYHSTSQHTTSKTQNHWRTISLKCHLFETLNTETELSVGWDPTVAFLQLRWGVPRDVVPGHQMLSSSMQYDSNLCPQIFCWHKFTKSIYLNWILSRYFNCDHHQLTAGRPWGRQDHSHRSQGKSPVSSWCSGSSCCAPRATANELLSSLLSLQSSPSSPPPSPQLPNHHHLVARVVNREEVYHRYFCHLHPHHNHHLVACVVYRVQLGLKVDKFWWKTISGRIYLKVVAWCLLVKLVHHCVRLKLDQDEKEE